MPELLTLRPPIPLPIPTTYNGSFLCLFARVGGSLTFTRYAPEGGYFYPAGVEAILGFDGAVSQYIIVVSRHSATEGFYLNTLGTVARTVLVDPPRTQTSFPAEPGETVVGRWVQDPFAATGWSHQAWLTDSYEVMPDGFTLSDGSDGRPAGLYLVFARSRPDGAIIGVISGAAVAVGLPPPTCPPGQVWNPDTRRCEPIAAPPPPPGPFADGDDHDALELGVTAILAGIATLAATQGQQQGGDGIQADCCNRVVLAIASVTAELGVVAQAVSSLAGQGGGGEPPPPIDLTPLVNKLNELVVAFTDPQAPIVSGQQALVDCVCKWLEQISGHLVTTRGAEALSIAEIAQRWFEGQDVPPEQLRPIFEFYHVAPELRQLLSGSPWFWDLVKALYALFGALTTGNPFNPAGLGNMFAQLFLNFPAWLVEQADLKVEFRPEGFKEGLFALFKFAPEIMNAFTTAIEPHVVELEEKWRPVIPSFLRLSQVVFGRAAAGAVNDMLAPLIALKEVSQDEIPDVMQHVLGTAFGGAMMARVVSAFFHLIPVLNTTGLQQFAGIFGELAGFAIVINAVLSPEIDGTLGTAGRRRANIQHRPHEPSLRDGQTWFARNLIEEDAVHEIAALNGLPTRWEAAYRDSSYRRLSILQIARLVQDVEFDPDEIRHELRAAGYSQQSIDRLMPILVRNSERSRRAAIETELVALAAEGLLSPADLDAQLASL